MLPGERVATFHGSAQCRHVLLALDEIRGLRGALAAAECLAVANIPDGT